MFSRSVKILTLLGFDIKVDPSWLLIAALIVWSLSSGYFPVVMPGATDEIYLGMAVFAMLGFFASLVLHELSHSVVARRYGVEIKGITLFVFGGIAELGSEPKTAASEFWIAVAGPAMSFVLAGLFWISSGLAGALVDSPILAVVLGYLGLLNFILAVFNMVPAFPLDGGRVYRAYLWHRSGNMLEATRRASELGTTFAYILMAIGVFSLFGGSQMGGLWQIFIGLFLLMAAKSTYQHQLIKVSLADKTVATMMTPDPIVTSPDLTLEELANQIMLRRRTSFVPVVDDSVLLGCVDSTVLASIDRENWPTTRVGDVFQRLDESNSVPMSMPAEEIMEKMTSQERRKFLVVDGRDGRRLVGVITLSDLLGYLQVLNELNPQRRGMQGRQGQRISDQPG
ncbi:MAG: site-2 protease family protein [Litoreibacter sp.]|nr:site-2 protease family protein [Litoreibacter sp.]